MLQRWLKRRLKQAGLPSHYSAHSFRATGITNCLENDGTLEAAQRIAGHADNRTTKLYDRNHLKNVRCCSFLYCITSFSLRRCDSANGNSTADERGAQAASLDSSSIFSSPDSIS